jgi:hypothetical protein
MHLPSPILRTETAAFSGRSGGACLLVHNTSSDFLATYATLHQQMRGGTPYARLRGGARLAAMHVKDTAHSPALYGTYFYLIEPSAPFRLTSVSPKVCFSDRRLELSSSARCALQYVTGLVVDEEANLALVSYGEMDLAMRVAALPLDRVLALARTHAIDEEGNTVSECAQPFHSP